MTERKTASPKTLSCGALRMSVVLAPLAVEQKLTLSKKEHPTLWAIHWATQFVAQLCDPGVGHEVVAQVEVLQGFALGRYDLAGGRLACQAFKQVLCAFITDVVVRK